LGAAAFVYFALATTPSHAWLDAGEVAAQSAALGLLHPPGTAGFVTLAHLATAIPLGPLGFRIALVSALFGAACVALTSAIWTRRGAGLASCALGAAWLCVGLSFARQARVADASTFAAFLLVCTVWGFDPALDAKHRFRARSLGVLAATFGAWAFADFRLLLGLPLFVAWVVALRREAAWARVAPLWVVVGSLPALALAGSMPALPGMLDLPAPRAFTPWWEYVVGPSATGLRGVGLELWLHQVGLGLERLAEDLGPFGPLVAVVAFIDRLGLGLGSASRIASDTPARGAKATLEDRTFVLGIALVFLLELSFAAWVGPARGPPRHTAMLAAWSCIVVVGVAAAAHVPRAGWLQAAFVPLAFGATVLPAALHSFDDAAATRSWGPHAWASRVFDSASTGALVITSGRELSAGWQALRVLEGARPDLHVVEAGVIERAGVESALRGPSRLEGEAVADVRIGAAWRAAEAACGGGDALRAFVRHWDAPAYVESPGVDTMLALEADLATPPPLGRVFMPHAPRESGPLRPDELRALLESSFETSLWRLETSEDRRRLAAAVGARVRAWLRESPESPEVLRTAADVYRDLLARTRLELPSVLVSLGALVAREGRFDEAIRLTRRALELEAGRRVALSNLALYLGRSPEGWDEARAFAQRAVDLHPEDLGVWRRLEAVCELQGDADCAARATRGVLRVAAPRPDVARQRCLERAASARNLP